MLSISIPMSTDVLHATADYMRALARIAEAQGAPVTPDVTPDPPIDTLIISGSTAYDGEYKRVCDVTSPPLVPEQRDAIQPPPPPPAGLSDAARTAAGWFPPPAPDAAPEPWGVPEKAQQIANALGGKVTDVRQDVDSAGEVYDARIHSSSRGTNKDGTWRTRRGVDPRFVEAVRRGDVPPPAEPSPPPPPVVTPERPASALNFQALMNEASTRHGSGGIARLNEIARELGVNGFAYLATSEEHLTAAWAMLTACADE